MITAFLFPILLLALRADISWLDLLDVACLVVCFYRFLLAYINRHLYVSTILSCNGNCRMVNSDKPSVKIDLGGELHRPVSECIYAHSAHTLHSVCTHAVYRHNQCIYTTKVYIRHRCVYTLPLYIHHRVYMHVQCTYTASVHTAMCEIGVLLVKH